MASTISAHNELLHEKGYLQNEDLRALAKRLNVPLYRIEGLVSFYPHYRRAKPPRVDVSLCRDVSCRLAGGSDFCERVRRTLDEYEGVCEPGTFKDRVILDELPHFVIEGMAIAALTIISLSGDVEKPGVYQVPMGTTIGELVLMAGGVRGGKNRSVRRRSSSAVVEE